MTKEANLYKCIFCEGDEVKIKELPNDVYALTCHNCGDYRITEEASKGLHSRLEGEYKGKKYLISGYLREMTELGLSFGIITTENYENLFLSIKEPATLMEKLDKLLLFLYRKTSFFHQQITVDLSQPAIAYAKNNSELEAMYRALAGFDYLVTSGDQCFLTVEGIRRAEELQKMVINSKQAFVAMWFNKEISEIYKTYISKAIIEAGYDPFIITMKGYNDDICDEIIAEIRKSKFLVADFTGLRGGVYFEAGFAYGLGIPVIWACRKDWFNQIVEEEEDVQIEKKVVKGFVKKSRHIHFDVNHYNFIVWGSGQDFYIKLKNRILATIPIRE